MKQAVKKTLMLQEEIDETEIFPPPWCRGAIYNPAWPNRQSKVDLAGETPLKDVSSRNSYQGLPNSTRLRLKSRDE